MAAERREVRIAIGKTVFRGRRNRRRIKAGDISGASSPGKVQVISELIAGDHPDRLSEEVPAGMVKLAEEKFQEIQSAYALVVTSRS